MINHIPAHHNNRHDIPRPDNFHITERVKTEYKKLNNLINPKEVKEKTAMDRLQKINRNRIQKGLEDESEYLPL